MTYRQPAEYQRNEMVTLRDQCLFDVFIVDICSMLKSHNATAPARACSPVIYAMVLPGALQLNVGHKDCVGSYHISVCLAITCIVMGHSKP